MNTLIGIFHILGSSLAWLLIGFLGALLLSRISTKIISEDEQIIANTLGVKVKELKNTDPRVVEKAVNDRFSSDLFCNRLSDFFGSISTLIKFSGLLVQICVLGACLWETYQEGIESAVYFWLMPASSILIGFLSFSMFWLCRLLTGRYPGQSRAIRAAART